MTFGLVSELPKSYTGPWWGARAILEERGFSLVWDRQSTGGPEAGCKDICDKLDAGTLKSCMAAVAELQDYELRNTTDKVFLLHDDGDLVVKANPRGSGGYLFLIAYYKDWGKDWSF